LTGYSSNDGAGNALQRLFVDSTGVAYTSKKHMALIVQKFGGTSVGTLDAIRSVADKVLHWRAQGHDLVVVVSAMAGETNRLLEMAHAVHSAPDPAELAVLLSTGEQAAAALLCMELNRQGCPARSCMGWQVSVTTDSRHDRANVEHVETSKLRSEISAGRVAVVAGFQGVDAAGRISILGRGGSDVTAVALAAALEADECQVYTDVDGVYTADPGIVEKARCLPTISFEAMAELSSLGAGVLHSRSVTVAAKHGLRLRVLNSFREGEGTLVTCEELSGGKEKTNLESPVISGIACSRDETEVVIRGIPETPDIVGLVLDAMDRAKLHAETVALTPSGEGIYDFSCTFPHSDYKQAMVLARRLCLKLRAQGCEGREGLAKVSVVAMGLGSRAGIVSRLLQALRQGNIKIRMLSSTQLRTSFVVETNQATRAVQLLHSACGLDRTKPPANGLQTGPVLQTDSV